MRYPKLGDLVRVKLTPPAVGQQIFKITDISDFLGPVTIQLNGGLDWFRADQFEVVESDNSYTLEEIDQ